jgi:hypothetical protein
VTAITIFALSAKLDGDVLGVAVELVGIEWLLLPALTDRLFAVAAATGRHWLPAAGVIGDSGLRDRHHDRDTFLVMPRSSAQFRRA